MKKSFISPKVTLTEMGTELSLLGTNSNITVNTDITITQQDIEEGNASQLAKQSSLQLDI